jgi:hypothetical protein
MKNTIISLFLLVSTISFSQTIKKENLENFLKQAEATHSEALIVNQDNKLVA